MSQYCYENSFDFIVLLKGSWESPGIWRPHLRIAELGCKASLNKLKWIDINYTKQNVCPQCNLIRHTITYTHTHTHRKCPLLSGNFGTFFKQSVGQRRSHNRNFLKICLELNSDKNLTWQNLWDIAKVIFKENLSLKCLY